jgi:hypothetical protein
MLLVLARVEIAVQDDVRGLVQKHDQAGCGFQAGVGGDDAPDVVGEALTGGGERQLAQRPSLRR